MPDLTAALVVVVMGAGAVAGCLGSLLGLGGGVFLVPFLNQVIGLDFKMSAAISLMTVIATSSAVSAGTMKRQLINLRLGMVLEIASAIGGLTLGILVELMSNALLGRIFAVVTAATAVLMLTRLERRNVLPPDASPGRLGGRFYEAESAGEVVYRVRRLPLALFVSLVAGGVSGTLGIGGGILKVPILNVWCGVPMRAAAATSALMIGVTAVSSAPIQYARGYVHPPFAAAAVLGVLLGSRVGFWLGDRARAKWLKLLMALVLGAVSTVYFIKGGR